MSIANEVIISTGSALKIPLVKINKAKTRRVALYRRQKVDMSLLFHWRFRSNSRYLLVDFRYVNYYTYPLKNNLLHRITKRIRFMNTKFLITISMLVSVHTTIPMLSSVSTTVKLALLKNQAQRAARYFHADGSNKYDKYAARLKITDPEDSSKRITIWDAVNKGDARATRFFLDAGVDPNVRRELDEGNYNQSRTLLGQALRFGWQWDKQNWSCLIAGRKRDYLSVIRLLLMKGASPVIFDTGVRVNDGLHRFYHPLELNIIDCARDSSSGAIPADIERSYEEIVTRLLEHGALANSVACSKDGRTPLHTHEHLEILLRHVAGADVSIYNKNIDVPDQAGNTPLHWCARNKLLARAKLLYQYGANPKLKNLAGKTPRDLASDDEAKLVFAVMELGEVKRHTSLDEGSFGEIWDDITLGSLTYSESKKCNAHGTNLLTWAVRKQSYRAVQLILKTNPGLINKPDQFGLTPLHWAAYGDNSDIVRILLDHGAPTYLHDHYYQTPVDIGYCGTPEVLKLLAEYKKN